MLKTNRQKVTRPFGRGDANKQQFLDQKPVFWAKLDNSDSRYRPFLIGHHARRCPAVATKAGLAVRQRLAGVAIFASKCTPTLVSTAQAATFYEVLNVDQYTPSIWTGWRTSLFDALNPAVIAPMQSRRILLIDDHATFGADPAFRHTRARAFRFFSVPGVFYKLHT